jgi:hypothetical protein
MAGAQAHPKIGLPLFLPSVLPYFALATTGEPEARPRDKLRPDPKHLEQRERPEAAPV